jgi:hypothetical protein
MRAAAWTPQLRQVDPVGHLGELHAAWVCTTLGRHDYVEVEGFCVDRAATIKP